LIWLLIASAVVVSIGRLLAPQADVLRPAIEGFLAARLGQPVRIERVEASWPRLSPQLSIRGLQIGEPGTRVSYLDRARLEIKLYNLVRPGRNSFELVVLGLDMRLLQDTEGRWSWRLDRGATLPTRWDRALTAGDLLVRDSRVEIVPRDFPALKWSVPEARVSRAADRVGVRLRADATGGPSASLDVRMLLDFDGSSVDSLRGYGRVLEIASIPTASDGAPVRVKPGAGAWLEWSRQDGGLAHARLGVDWPASEAAGSGDAASDLVIDIGWGDRQGFRAEINARSRDSEDRRPIVGLAAGTAGERYGLVADRVDLRFVHALVSPWADRWPAWPEQLAGLASSLEIAGTRGEGFQRFSGQFDDLDVDGAWSGAGLSGLTVDLALDGDAAVLKPAGAVELRLPELYPDPIRLSRIGGAVQIREGLVRLDGLRLVHEEVDARVDGAVLLGDGSPYLDLVVDTPRLSSETPRRWLPGRGLPPKTRNWLDEALLGVETASAVTTLHGRPLDWRRHVPDAAVSSDIAFSGLRLAYARGWPAAERVSGRVEFIGERMVARVDSGRVAGVSLRAPRVRIADTRNARVELGLETADGVTARDLARLTVALPLDAADRAFGQMSWSGPASARASVWLPVRNLEDWRLVGSVGFSGAGFGLNEHGLQLNEIGGELPFTRDGLGPALIRAEIEGESVDVALKSRWKGGFSMSLSGAFPAPALVPDGWRAARPELFRAVDGKADFELEFLGAGDQGDEGLRLQISSDLRGVRSTLPEPLSKPRDASLPLTLDVPLGDDRIEPLEFTLGGIARGAWLQTGRYWQLGLGLGGARIDLPAAENFRIEGRVPILAADAWAALLRGGDNATPIGSGPDETVSGWMNVSVDDLRLESGSLGALDAVLSREQDYWRFNLDGERIRGSLRFPASAAAERSLVANFERVHWPRAGAARDRPPGAPSTLDPASIPALNLVIDDLRFGGLALGEFRFKSHRIVEGIEIEQLSAQREGFELSGSGAWTRTGPAPVTQMRIRLSTDDLGQALTDSGFDIAMQNGLAVINLDGAWPGSPLDLSLERLEGRINLVVSEGVIPEASPGAGRLLGLVSLNSIPRRLRLDFTDVFGEGLAFDRLDGDFTLTGGLARTDNLRIDAPAAEILMRGQTDLADRRYDQTLIVRPGVSSALPVIGALAGGPVGAAAGAALQQIFSGPLSGISEIRYSVTGSWDDPIIEPVSVRSAPEAESG